MSGRQPLWFGVLTLALLAVVPAQATSHVRIVRLSYESGGVKMERSPGQGLEHAILNSPVVEGSRIVTGSDGLAEVEFENNTVVRLGENTEVRFRQLLMDDAGDKVNEVELLYGTLYFDTRSAKKDINRVVVGGTTLDVQRDSQVRFQTSADQVQVASMRGSAFLQTSAEPVKVPKNDTLTLSDNSATGFVLTKGVDSIPIDRWNSERAAYQSAYAYDNSGYGSKGLSAYGYADLAYYGGFQFLPGYGMVWQPYGASSWMGWDPYSSGAWVLASGGQYVWASAYPWGWMPYHYGSWIYVPAGGWFWSPGNSFKGGGVVTNWQGTAPVVNGPSGYKGPIAPSPLPGNPRPTVLVGRIGRGPAYLPDGPTPPNFRSVIDRSNIAGVKAPVTGATGAGSSFVGARNSRAVNMGSMNAGNSRHVFAAPPPAASLWQGFGSPSVGVGIAGSPSLGRSSLPMNSSVGASRATSPGGSHGSNPSPK